MADSSDRWCGYCNKNVSVIISENTNREICSECENSNSLSDGYVDPYIVGLRFTGPNDDENRLVHESELLYDLEGITRVKIQNPQKCSICLRDLSVGDPAQQLRCGHKFHDNCITIWFGSSPTCPECRYQLPPEDFIRKGCVYPPGGAAGSSGST